MTTDLSTTTAQLSSLTMEMSTIRKNEADLKQQLATTVTELQKNTQNWATLKQAHEGKQACRTLTHTVCILCIIHTSHVYMLYAIRTP